MAKREYTPEEIEQIKAEYEEAEKEYGCGYWPVCYEHDCFCSMDAEVSQGFSIDVWERLHDEMHEQFHEDREEIKRSYELEVEYDPELGIYSTYPVW